MAFKGTARVGALDFKRESAILDTLDEGCALTTSLFMLCWKQSKP